MARRASSEQTWATGGLLFAATILLMVGLWQVIVGIVAIVDGEFFVVGRSYTYEIDTTAWGWIHLILGALAAAAGFFLFTDAIWARAVGIGIAILSAINNFIFLPYYPLWAISVIALDVFVIWALATADTSQEEFMSESAGYRRDEAPQTGERWPTNRPAASRADEAATSPTGPKMTADPTKMPPLGRQ